VDAEDGRKETPMQTEAELKELYRKKRQILMDAIAIADKQMAEQDAAKQPVTDRDGDDADTGRQ
jgi:hypothetical protein